MIVAKREVAAVRLYSKTPGTDRLRKSAENDAPAHDRRRVAGDPANHQPGSRPGAHGTHRPKVPHMTQVRSSGDDGGGRSRRG